MTTVIILALIGFSGQIAAVILSAWLQARNSQRSLDKQTSELEKSNQRQNAGLDAISKVATNTNKVATATHKIVNSQRTNMLRTIAMLARQLADLNPEDDTAQLAAANAEKDAEQAHD